MRVDLAGRKALVTGASTGIGRAIAVALARAGCDVAVGYRASRQEAEEVAGLIRAAGRNTVVLEGDVALEEQAKAVVEGAASALGGLDILVNNAGSLIQRTPLTEADTQVWRRVMGTNLDSVYYCTRYAVPYLRQSAAGRVINMGSVAGHTGGGPGRVALRRCQGRRSHADHGLCPGACALRHHGQRRRPGRDRHPVSPAVFQRGTDEADAL